MHVPPVRVLLAAGHPIYRHGLWAVLNAAEGLEVVGEALDGTEAVDAMRAVHPDVVVLDALGPGSAAMDATDEITSAHGGAAVLLLTDTDDEQTILRALQKGARGCLLRDAGRETIVRAIHSVANGEMILGPSIAQRIRLVLASCAPADKTLLPDLTPRQYEILELIAQGLSNQAIARQLMISDKRVRNCVTQIYAKLNVPDRGHAIIRGRQAGLGQGQARN